MLVHLLRTTLLLAAVSCGASTPVTAPQQGAEDRAVYMSLLQLHTKSNASMRPDMGNDKALRLKTLRPYYHTSDEIRDEANRLKDDCGGAMTLETHSDSDVDIDVVRIRAPGSSPVNKVFLLFGEHSRELISPESGLHMLKMICGKTATTGMDSQITMAQLLKDNEFQFVLNGNPHSRRNVEKGDFCLRTNPNGVDLNRNWDEMWSNAESGDTNAGPHPFSEAETRIFKKLAQEYKPTTFVTVHSGTRGLYMPWAYDVEHVANYNAPLMLQVLKEVDQKHCQCPFGAAGKEVGYPCPGTCLDWVYSNLKTPFVFAFEIYTSEDQDKALKSRWDKIVKDGGAMLLQSGSHLGHEHFAELFDDHASDFVSRRKGDEIMSARPFRHSEDCFPQFNPDGEKKYNDTVQNWAVAYLEMTSRVGELIKKDPSILSKMREPKYKVY